MAEMTDKPRGFGVLAAARALGMRPRALKLVIAMGGLQPPDLSAASGFALARFSCGWLEAAQSAAPRHAWAQGGGLIIFAGKFRRREVEEFDGVERLPVPDPVDRPPLPEPRPEPAPSEGPVPPSGMAGG